MQKQTHSDELQGHRGFENEIFTLISPLKLLFSEVWFKLFVEAPNQESSTAIERFEWCDNIILFVYRGRLATVHITILIDKHALFIFTKSHVRGEYVIKIRILECFLESLTLLFIGIDKLLRLDVS